MRSVAREVHQSLPEVGAKSRGAAGGRLGTASDVLSVSSRTLDTLEDDEHRGVAVRNSTAAHDGSQTLQASGACHRPHLETLASGPVHLSQAQGCRVATCGLCGSALCGWRRTA